jgi:excisionase family DNA binding protein
LNALLKPDDVAELLNSSRRQVYELHRRGLLPAVRWYEGGPLRFRREDVERLVQPQEMRKPDGHRAGAGQPLVSRHQGHGQG